MRQLARRAIAIGRFTPALVLAYATAWTLGYAAVTDPPSDFRYYFQYLWLAWTFNGFERPTIAWVFSLILFVPIAAAYVLLQRAIFRAAAESKAKQLTHRRRYTR